MVGIPLSYWINLSKSLATAVKSRLDLMQSEMTDIEKLLNEALAEKTMTEYLRQRDTKRKLRM